MEVSLGQTVSSIMNTEKISVLVLETESTDCDCKWGMDINMGLLAKRFIEDYTLVMSHIPQLPALVITLKHV